MRILFKLIILQALIGSFCHQIFGQGKVVDQVVAVVGSGVILQSELEAQYLQYIAQGYRDKGNLRCDILEELLSQKLLLNQAKIDSIEVGESQVDSELDRRMQYFISQLGSKEKVEEYYKKSVLEIKEDLRGIIRDQLITQRMKGEIVGEISVSPSEVKSFYKNEPQDSIPYVNSEIEVQQICIYPPFNEDAKYEVREKLLGLRERILKGESFAALAVLYSEDNGSSKKGGELGFLNRSDLVKEFADVAFALKEGNVSKIVETEFGFHIIQLIERRENQVNVRHILMKPKASAEQKVIAKTKLDSIATLIRNGEITFEEAARKYSEDTKTRLNGGLKVNPYTGNSKYELGQLEPAESYIAKELETGMVSSSFETQDDKGKEVYKIMTVKSRSKPHKANLEEDYTIIQNMVRSKKQLEVITAWLKDKQEDTYIHIDEMYKNCSFKSSGWIK